MRILYISKKLVACTLLTIMLLISFEGLIRAFDLGTSRALFRTANAPQDGYVINLPFYFQFFPYELEKSVDVDTSSSKAITKLPEHNTCRIVVLGGSVALGDVPDPAFAFPRVLTVMLENVFPNISFEVLNLAAPALNSHVMRLATHESVFLKPHFYLVYMGNNEYIGPYGPAWTEWLPESSETIHAQLRLRQVIQQSRIAELILQRQRSGVIAALNPREYFELSRKISQASPERERLYENYKANLQGIIDRAASSGAEVLISSVAVNLRHWPPLSSFNASTLTPEEKEDWKGLYETAKSGLSTDDQELLIRSQNAAQNALALDNAHAGLQYIYAQLLWKIANYEDSRAAFQKARDLDGFAITADSKINQIARETATNQQSGHAYFVDTEGRFSRASEHGIPGNMYFFDAMHVLYPGNYLIAASFFEVLAPLVHKRFMTRNHSLAPPNYEPLSEEACAERLGLSPYLITLHLESVRQEIDAIRTLNPAFDATFIDAQLECQRRALEPQARDDALESVERAIALRSHDTELYELRKRLLERLVPNRD